LSTSFAGRVPATHSELIGREHDIAEIAALVAAPGRHLVTLTGPGGVGKTRLGIAVATMLENRFTDGVRFLDLTAITDPEQVIPAVLNMLGLREEAVPSAQLARALERRSLLLILDNFEQVLEAGPDLNHALAHAQAVRTIVTSRAPLNVSGERVYEVAPLAVPSLPSAGFGSSCDLESLASASAVELFAARARAVRPSFALTSATIEPTAQICRLLDGLPLAIELTAARCRVLSPEATLQRLQASMALLRNGPRDAAPRHQSLEQTIAWSYELLRPSEALLLDRLSVFSGSFALDAAESVAADGPIDFQPSAYFSLAAPLGDDRTPLLASEVLPTLEQLVEQSLVQRVESAAESPRFRLFETVRQFAEARLIERGEREQTAMRHALYFRAMTEATWGATGAPLADSGWFMHLAPDRENYRAALDYTQQNDPAEGASFAAGLFWFFYNQLAWKEGARAIERTEGRYAPEQLPFAARCRIECARGSLLALFAETRDDALHRLDTLGASAEPANPQWAIGYAIAVSGIVAERAGDHNRTLDALRNARTVLGNLDSGWTGANLRYHEALAYFGLGAFERARMLATSVLETDPDIAGLNIAYAHHAMGLIAIAERRPATAAHHIAAGLDFMTQCGIEFTWTDEVDAIAAIAAQTGDLPLAATVFGIADRLHQQAGSPVSLPERTIYAAQRDATLRLLGADDFQRYRDEGTALSREAAFMQMHAALSRAQQAGDRIVTFEQQDDRYGLTPNERATMRLIALGHTDREIAAMLDISHATARARVRSILQKLDVPSRSAATTVVLREGLITVTETDQGPPVP